MKNKPIESNLARLEWSIYPPYTAGFTSMSSENLCVGDSVVLRAIPKLIGAEQDAIFGTWREASNRQALSSLLLCSLRASCVSWVYLSLWWWMMVNSQCSLPKLSFYERIYICSIPSYYCMIFSYRCPHLELVRSSQNVDAWRRKQKWTVLFLPIFCLLTLMLSSWW